MSTTTSASSWLLALALLVAVSGPALAQEAPPASAAPAPQDAPPQSAAAPSEEPPPAPLTAESPQAPAAKDEPLVIDAKLSLGALIESASRAFAAQKYDVALAYLNAAYARRPLPPILFNIAQAQRKAGHPHEALQTYQRFLKEAPDSPLAPEASAHAAAMQARIEVEQATNEKAQAEQRSTERTAQAEQLARERERERLNAEAALRTEIARKEQPVYKRKWFWGLLSGLVGAAIVTGVTLAIVLQPPSEPVGDFPTQALRF